ncbi:MAG: helix-turn-helix domain-containing protein [Bacteroidota bacterium]
MSIIGAVQSFFLATLFLSKKGRNLPRRILAVVFLLIGCLLLDHHWELTGLVFESPHLLGLTYTLPLLLGPLLLFYTLQFVPKTPPSFRQFASIHFLPWVISMVYLVPVYYSLSGGQKLEFYHQETEVSVSTPIWLLEIALLLVAPFYSTWSLVLLRKNHGHLRSYFSDQKQVSLAWWGVSLLFFVALSVLSLGLSFASDGIGIMSYQLADSITMAGLTLAVFFLGYFGIQRQALHPAGEISIGNERVSEPARHPVSADAVSQVIEALEQEKLYLNSKLTLLDLAVHLGTTENKLSYVINQGLGNRFYDLGNTYRVQEVKDKLVDPAYSHLSILGIALESGFNSKSSFQQVFKNFTGMTPSQFKKSHTKES